MEWPHGLQAAENTFGLREIRGINWLALKVDLELQDYGVGSPRLDRLNSVAVDSDGNRSLDAVYGNNQTSVVVDPREHSTNTIQTAPADSDLLAQTNKRMRRKGNSSPNNGLYCFDLFVGDGDTHAPHAHKAKHTVCLQNVDAGVSFSAKPDEHIVAEQGKMNLALSVAPLAHFSEQG